MKKKITSILSVILIGALLLCAGCSNTPGDVNSDIKGHLVIYTSEPQDLATEMLEAFREKYPGVTYELYRSGTGNVTAKIDAELAAGKTEANIAWFADIGYMYGLDKQGLIYHYTPAALDSVPEAYKYNDGMGYEVRAIYAVLEYNTTRIANAPKDWMDVTGPEYKDVLAIANPSYSGGAFTTLVNHIQNESLVGWDFYEAMRDNGVKFEQSNGNLQTKVSSGEYSAVITMDYLARTAKAEGSPVDYVYPASGAVMVPTPFCLLNTLDDSNTEAAKALADFMFEPETQKLFVEQGYVPMNKAAVEGTDVPTTDDIKLLDFDLDFFVDNSSAIRKQFENMFGAQ